MGKEKDGEEGKTKKEIKEEQEKEEREREGTLKKQTPPVTVTEEKEIAASRKDNQELKDRLTSVEEKVTGLQSLADTVQGLLKPAKPGKKKRGFKLKSLFNFKSEDRK